MRHIQLKATRGRIAVHRALAQKPSACVDKLEPAVDHGGRHNLIQLIWERGVRGPQAYKGGTQQRWPALHDLRAHRTWRSAACALTMHDYIADPTQCLLQVFTREPSGHVAERDQPIVQVRHVETASFSSQPGQALR